MPSMPRSDLAASSRAWAAASRHDSVDTPTRSIVLITDIARSYDEADEYTSIMRR